MTQPSGDFLDVRRKALEESFFAEKDYRLLQSLRNELHDLEERRQLAHVSSILNEKVLQDLVECGIRAETLAAVRMIPWIDVAWSDGDVSAEERAAILKAAHEVGVKEGTACHKTLEAWLITRPDERLIETWKAYMVELTKMMPADTMATFRDELIERLNSIASASGGFLGFAKISKSEMDCIDKLTNFLQETPKS
jgi:tellurite resistance protein